MYANEVENHLLSFSLSNDVKVNWQHLKDIILKVGYQYFKRHVCGNKMSSFPCNSWFDDECKMYLKWFKSIEGQNEKIVAWRLYKKVVRRKKRRYFQMQEMKKKLV